MNRVILFLDGGTQRRARETERLKELAKSLTDRIDIEGADVCYFRRLSDDDGPDRLTLSLCLDWSIDREQTAVEEICQRLQQTAAQLTAAVARLEGGAV